MLIFSSRKIHSFKILVSRARYYKWGIIPTFTFKLRYNVVCVYDTVKHDDDNGRTMGKTIIHHDNETIVDYYWDRDSAEQAKLNWENNIGSSTLESY